MEKWRLLCLKTSDPHLNMAIEEAVLIAVNEGKSPSTVRFWRNARSVVLGRSQNIADEINIKECERHGVRVVRRFTGGGAVYQDFSNLNWTFVISRNSKLFPENFSTLYKLTCMAVIEGLKDLYLNAEFKQPNSIWIGDKKVSGLAAYIKRNAALCHGTLLVNTDINMVSKVLLRPRYPVTNIRNELKDNGVVSIFTIERAILRGFQKLYKIQVKPKRLSKYESSISRSLYEEKYGKNFWNLKGMHS
jgi:lipoate-protein ligase A